MYEMTTSDYLLLAIMYTIMFGLPGLYAYYMFRPARTRNGQIEMGGIHYAYELGDGIRDVNGSKFAGLSIILPTSLPNIYIDGHTSDGLLGPRYAFDKKYKLSLEGDFDRHFQVYVMPEHRRLALSVLTPDVMQTLLSSAIDYDIEIATDRLRVISRSRVYKDPEAQQAMFRVAEPILAELMHRMRSWQHSDASTAGVQLIPVTELQMVKIGRTGFAHSTVFYWSLFTLNAAVLLSTAFVAQDIMTSSKWRFIWFGVLIGPAIWFAIWIKSGKYKTD